MTKYLSFLALYIAIVLVPSPTLADEIDDRINALFQTLSQHETEAEAKAKEIEAESNAANARQPNPALAHYDAKANGSNVTFTYVKKRNNRSTPAELRAEDRMIRAEVVPFSCAKAQEMPEFQWGLNFTYVFKTNLGETISVIPVTHKICSSIEL